MIAHRSTLHACDTLIASLEREAALHEALMTGLVRGIDDGAGAGLTVIGPR